MSKDPKSPKVEIEASTLAELIEAAVDKRVAAIMTAKSPDDRIAEEMARQRGTNRPPLPERFVDCYSPVTKATFRARLQRKDGVAVWRVVELLDYQRPDGWDVHRADGGLVPDGVEMVNHQTRQPAPKFMWEVHKNYYKRDNDLLMGRELPEHFHKAFLPAPGSVVLSPDQLAVLGITAEQVKSALEPKAAE